MRKICILLCLSILTSLIHAAVMKVDLPGHTSSDQISSSESSAHHCDEEVNKPTDSNPKHPCHGGSSLCCLSLVVLPSLDMQLNIRLTEILASTYSPLVPKTMVNLIYRPPKA